MLYISSSAFFLAYIFSDAFEKKEHNPMLIFTGSTTVHNFNLYKTKSHTVKMNDNK